MITQTYFPRFPLNQFVDYFFFYEGYAPAHSVERFLPDGNVELIIDLDDTPKFIYDNETLKEAYQLMKAQAPFVLTYDYIVTSIQNPEVGPQVHMALGYSGDQHVLNDKAGTPGVWRYAVPKEGTLSWLDCMSVVANSPNKDRALALLDYLGSPGSAAANALALNMPTVSRAAYALLPEEVRADPAIYPSPDILARSQYQQELSTESVQLRRRIISTLANFQ